jgi:hypothetical protein
MKGLGWGAAVVLSLGVAACGGGGGKGADSPGTCPDGTVLKGSDCVPASAASSDSSGDDALKTKAPRSDPDQAAASAASSDTGSGGATYDKDAVEIELKRAARQVKANCGSATDDDGAATGPWGKTTASVTLGRNGHVKQVTVPAPYDGKAAGICIVHAFQKIQFPPYGGPSDVVVDREVELVKPKH